METIGKITLENIGEVKITKETLPIVESFLTYAKLQFNSSTKEQDIIEEVKGKTACGPGFIWSKKEEDYLKKHKHELPEKIANELNRSVGSVYTKARRMNISLPTRRSYHVEKLKVLQHLQGKTEIFISNILKQYPEIDKEIVLKVISDLLAEGKAKQLSADRIVLLNKI